MRHYSLPDFLLIFCLGLTVTSMQGRDLYVAPGGKASGRGTPLRPYNLATALSGRAGGPGDTFWLEGGDYSIGHINTKIQGAPGRPITFRSRPGEWARVDGSVEFWDSRGYVVLRDFEIYSSDTNRASSQRNAEFKPTDVKLFSGIASFSPNLSFINLVVHDATREGIYVSQTSSNNLIYGCIIYNIGWKSVDNAEGHGIYMQGWDGGREVADNIVFNNSGADLHIYDDTAGYPLENIVVKGNVAFNGGAIQNVRYYRDTLVGVDRPSTFANNIIFENNMGYFASDNGRADYVQIGREGTNGSVIIKDNYLPEGLELNNWCRAVVTGNVFGAPAHCDALQVKQRVPLRGDWDNNTYVISPNADGETRFNSHTLAFSDWKKQSRCDSNSACTVGKFTGTKIFMRPNRYEKGRADIIVYNWDNLNTVAVDVSSVLSRGDAYEVRNAEDYFARPVLSGVYDAQPLKLPMAGLSVAAPNGPMMTPQPTGPAFNVFVLLKKSQHKSGGAGEALN